MRNVSYNTVCDDAASNEGTNSFCIKNEQVIPEIPGKKKKQMLVFFLSG